MHSLYEMEAKRKNECIMGYFCLWLLFGTVESRSSIVCIYPLNPAFFRKYAYTNRIHALGELIVAWLDSIMCWLITIVFVCHLLDTVLALRIWLSLSQLRDDRSRGPAFLTTRACDGMDQFNKPVNAPLGVCQWGRAASSAIARSFCCSGPAD